MLKLKGLATGVGSLPHINVEEALDLIFKYTPKIPFWPQLPKRDAKEAMVAQSSQGLPCLKVSNSQLIFNDTDKERELEVFYEKVINKDIDYFKISQDFAAGLWGLYKRLEKAGLAGIEFIKCQICGPFSFAAGINDRAGRAILHDQVMMQAVLKGLTMKALWQIRLFRKFNKPIIIFLDEPYLGCFGSAYTPLNREDVVKGLTEISEGIKAKDVLVGVHCCGNTDWSIFTDIPTIDIISFDAYSYLDKLLLYADNLKAFFNRSGILCWGIVPTQEFSGQSPKDLSKKIIDARRILGVKGVSGGLMNNMLLSPACGLGTLDVQKAEAIFETLYRMSGLV